MRFFLPLFAISLTLACGGGGGGAAGSSTTYKGKTTAVGLSSGNAEVMVSAVMDGNGGTGSVGDVSSKPQGSSHMSSFSHRFLRSLRSKSLRMAPVAIQDREFGSVSGTLDFSGSIDNVTGFGYLDMTYDNFNDNEGYTYTGRGRVTVPADNRVVITMDDLTVVSSDEESVIGDGTMDITYEGTSFTTIYDILMTQVSSGNQIMWENLTEVSTFSNTQYTGAFSSTLNGRIYESSLGYVDITTLSALEFTGVGDTSPGIGGSFILEGSNGSKSRLTSLGGSAFIEIDEDGDGVYESNETQVWENFEI